MKKNFVLELASSCVAEYSNGFDEQSAEQTSLDEEHLQRAIDAFRTLVTSEAFMRAAAYRGLFDFDEQTKSALLSLYEQWLTRCEETDRQIALLGVSRPPRNLDAFQRARDQAWEIIARQQLVDSVWQSASSQLSSESW